jgi:hypothetical protein
VMNQQLICPNNARAGAASFQARACRPPACRRALCGTRNKDAWCPERF